MAKKKVYYSFYYDEDASRVQQVINMGIVEGQQMLSGQKWEEVRKKGDKAVENWIATEMNGKDCLVVLIGTNTSKRPWVTYEIKKAWADGLGVIGIRIHGLKDLATQKTSARGDSPFSDMITPYDPPGADSKAVYASISNNIETLVANAKRKPR